MYAALLGQWFQTEAGLVIPGRARAWKAQRIRTDPAADRLMGWPAPLCALLGAALCALAAAATSRWPHPPEHRGSHGTARTHRRMRCAHVAHARRPGSAACAAVGRSRPPPPATRPTAARRGPRLRRARGAPRKHRDGRHGDPVRARSPARAGIDRMPGSPSAPPSMPHVEVTAVEYSFTLSRPTVPAGKVILHFVNHGQDEHNLNAAARRKANPWPRSPTRRSGEVRQLWSNCAAAPTRSSARCPNTRRRA